MSGKGKENTINSEGVSNRNLQTNKQKGLQYQCDDQSITEDIDRKRLVRPRSTQRESTDADCCKRYFRKKEITCHENNMRLGVFAPFKK